tara:strand:- start:111 stop:341 length:231 start_codon:yes stop_codon:yes gene_type:complete
MNTPREKAILHVANNVLSTFTLEQANTICRDFAFIKAEAYYDGLEDTEKRELEKKVEDFIAEQEKALKTPQETQPS